MQQRDAVKAARTPPPSVAFCRAFDLSINVFVRFGRTYGLYPTRGSRAFFEFLLGAIGWEGSPANAQSNRKTRPRTSVDVMFPFPISARWLPTPAETPATPQSAHPTPASVFCPRPRRSDKALGLARAS